MRSLRWACVRPLGLERPPFGTCALPWGRALSLWKHKFCMENDMCAIRLARAPSLWLAHAPSGMCALRLACTHSSWLVRLPLDPRALPWACVPSNPLGLERSHFGPRALPWAHAHSLWKPQILQGKRHVRHLFDTRALRLACARSLGKVPPPFGMHALILASAPSDWPAPASLGMRAPPWA